MKLKALIEQIVDERIDAYLSGLTEATPRRSYKRKEKSTKKLGRAPGKRRGRPPGSKNKTETVATESK